MGIESEVSPIYILKQFVCENFFIILKECLLGLLLCLNTILRNVINTNF